MSRLFKYRESLTRFINERSPLVNSDISDIDRDIIKEYITEKDLILPILLLTIMNSQNKKNNISTQGYYAASAIEFTKVLFGILDNRCAFVKKHGDKKYGEIILLLQSLIIKSLTSNIESIKNHISIDRTYNILNDVLEIYTNCISYNTIDLESSETKPNNDLYRWYIKKVPNLKDRYKQIKKVKQESLLKYFEDHYVKLCTMTLEIGWIIGGGEKKQLSKVSKLAKHFATMYKLSIDFTTIDNDIIDASKILSSNYIINYGLQNGYEVFMENKEKFINAAMNLDIYTSTVNEIIVFIESSVDEVIDMTSPDIKSNYSAILSA